MKEYLKGLIRCFYSKSFYSEVAHRWRGGGVGFLFVACTLGAFISSLFFTSQLSYFRTLNLDRMAEEMPAITIYEGKLSTSTPGPHIVHLSDNPRLLMMIDARPFDKNLDETFAWMKKNQIFAFVTEDKIINLSKEDSKLEVFEIGKIGEASYTREDWRSFARVIQKWGLTVSFIFIFITFTLMSWIVSIIKVFFLALSGLLLRKIMKTPLDFSALRRVGSAALVPHIFLKFLGLPGLVWLLIVLGYYIFGLWSSKTPVSEAAAP